MSISLNLGSYARTIKLFVKKITNYVSNAHTISQAMDITRK